MPITPDKDAEKILQDNPDLAEDVAAYALYLAKVRAKHSDQSAGILRDAALQATQDNSTWEQRSAELAGILDEITRQVSESCDGN